MNWRLCAGFPKLTARHVWPYIVVSASLGAKKAASSALAPQLHALSINGNRETNKRTFYRATSPSNPPPPPFPLFLVIYGHVGGSREGTVAFIVTHSSTNATALHVHLVITITLSTHTHTPLHRHRHLSLLQSPHVLQHTPLRGCHLTPTEDALVNVMKQTPLKEEKRRCWNASSIQSNKFIS